MFKTIVVHVSPASGMPDTFDSAARLAATYGAHLVGTTASGVVELNYLAGSDAPMVMMPPWEANALRQNARTRLEQFEAQCRSAGVASYETRMLDTSAVEALLLQARYCDLLLAGLQDLEDYGLLLPPRLPGQLVTRCVRPVLLIPPGKPMGPHGFQKILLAWNGSPAASRALAFSLPLVQRASKVLVAVCNPQREQVDMGGEPGADIATYLARHHRDVEVLRLETSAETGSALCQLAQERRVDLLVAGAYGHSRLHEWILGSTTASLIEQSRTALLMSQ